MYLQPIYATPALKVDNAIVIGDLHIGVESHLRSKGFHLISHTSDMYETIIQSADEDINRLIVLGDVKDSVPGTTKQEYAEIPDFFEKLLERFDIIDLVRGNHDTQIEEFLPPQIHIRPASGFKVNYIGFIHGHIWPSEDVMACNTLVMAHNHPTVMFQDGIGRCSTEPCWMRGTFTHAPNQRYKQMPNTFVMIPAFNRMLGGSPVNVIGENMLGPLINSDLVDIDNAHLYLLDGLDLGKRRNLMIEGRRFENRF